jgi:hypothetical protein
VRHALVQVHLGRGPRMAIERSIAPRAEDQTQTGVKRDTLGDRCGGK